MSFQIVPAVKDYILKTDDIIKNKSSEICNDIIDQDLIPIEIKDNHIKNLKLQYINEDPIKYIMNRKNFFTPLEIC